MIILVRPEQSLPKSIAYFHQHGIACHGLAVQTIDASPMLSAALNADMIEFKRSAKNQGGHLFDATIVTSRYAAKALIAELKSTEVNLSELTKCVIAVGQSTADQLDGIDSHRKIIIPHRHDSEGVLSLPELQAIAQQRIALIKGIGGRELLASTLARRGALMIEYPVYQRRLLDFDLSVFANESDTIDLVIVTSGEAATILLSSAESSWLKEPPWLVISERIAKLVGEQGVSSVYISAGASDSALIKCAQEIME